LVRFCAAENEAELEKLLMAFIKPSGGGGGYAPTRQSEHDALNASKGFFDQTTRVPRDQILRQVISACSYGRPQETRNLETISAVYDAGIKNNWSCRYYWCEGVNVPVSGSVKFWSDMIIVNDGIAFLPYFDYRQERGIITGSQKNILYSLQHHWVRKQDPDLISLSLGLVRFPRKNGIRYASVELSDRNDSLFSIEELEERILTVYRKWAELSLDKPARTKRSGTDGRQDNFPF